MTQATTGVICINPEQDRRVATLNQFKYLNLYSELCHQDNQKWWYPIEPPKWWQVALNWLVGWPLEPQKLQRNDGELLMLMVSEIAEAMEGVRKNLKDNHLPTRSSVEVELADLLIRVFDYAGGRGLDLDGAFWAKRQFNLTRPDHSHTSRRQANGKKF